MNPKHKIIWAHVAEKDLKNIIEYISTDNPQNALKILKKSREKLQIFILFLKEAASYRRYPIKPLDLKPTTFG